MKNIMHMCIKVLKSLLNTLCKKGILLLIQALEFWGNNAANNPDDINAIRALVVDVWYL